MTETNEKIASLKSRSLASLFWRVLERGGSALVQMVVQVVMARLLTPRDFGALAIMLVFVNLGNVFVQSGLNTALIQASHVDEGGYSTVFWMSFAVAVTIYLGIFATSPWIAASYHMPQLVWPLRVLCFLLVVNSYNAVQIAKVTRDLDMRKTFVATLVSVIVSGALGICTALAGGGLWALVVQQLSYQLVNCIMLALQVSWHPTLIFLPKEARELFSFGWKLLVSGLLDTGYQSLSDLIIGANFTVEALGIFSQGKKYPQAVSGAINGAIAPVMLSTVAHVSSDMDRARAVTRRALKSSCYVVMPAMAMLACMAPTLVELLLGDKWSACVPYMQVICISSAFLPVHSTNIQSLNAMGRSDLSLRLEIIKKSYGVLNLLFCTFVLRDMWLLCCSYLVTSVFSQIVNAWPNRTVLRYGYLEQLRDILPGILLSMAAAVPVLMIGLLRLSTHLTLLCQTLVFVCVYIGLSHLFHVEVFEYLLRTLLDGVASYDKGR